MLLVQDVFDRAINDYREADFAMYVIRSEEEILLFWSIYSRIAEINSLKLTIMQDCSKW